MTPNCNYLLVNSTNEFLLEYTPLEENDCYKLTNFSGGVGDSLICPDGRIKLFVDGRFHTQADLEVDTAKVDVIKLEVGQSQDETICTMIEPNSTLCINTKKVSQNRYEFFETLLKEIGVKIVPNPQSELIQRNSDTVAINMGSSFTEKYEKIEKPIIITNSEELTYVCNLRDFSQDYAVKIDGKLLILKDKSILFTDFKILAGTEFEVKPLSEFDNFIQTIEDTIVVDKSTITAYDYSLIKNKKQINRYIILCKNW